MRAYLPAGLTLAYMFVLGRRWRVEHRALVRLEREFRLSLDAAPIGVALVATDGRFLRVNESLARIVGYQVAELQSLTFQDITHPDDLAADLELLQETLEGRRAGYTMEKRYLRRDGATVTVQLDVSVVRDDAGGPSHLIAQIQDVTDRNAVLAALQRTEATQRACLDAMEQGIALSDLEGNVHLLNRAGREIVGYDTQELTELFRSGRWETYDEHGEPLAPADRPIRTTMDGGTAVSDRIVAWRHAGGHLVTLRVATEPVRDEDGELVGVVTAFADITKQRALERAEAEAVSRLEWQATHDPLTGLANRGMLVDRLEAALAARGSGEVALLFADLDHFKLVNDTMGHAVGDEVLVAIAGRLERAVRRADTVARFGGDEFVVLAPDLRDPGDAELLAIRIADELASPIQTSAGAIEVDASIGIALASGQSTDALLRDADTALYRAKHNGRGTYAFLGSG